MYGSAEWANQRGANACWRHGAFIGQKVLVNIVGTGGELEQITLESLEPYLNLVAEAAKLNLAVGLESGFRTFAKQKALHDGFLARKPGFNLAAAPGNSNHQHGQAFDLNTGGFDGHPIYDWLKQHGPSLGFIRTVNKEHWHWEYMPNEAPAFVKAKKFKLDKVAI
jgi:LAS superfamily LD-carboxypeptidase LdcB